MVKLGKATITSRRRIKITKKVREKVTRVKGKVAALRHLDRMMKK